MEKFGIFELLDALSAMTETPPEKEEEQKTPDRAFMPPEYGTAGEAVPPPEPQKPPKTEADALAGFYARHDAVAKKAKK